MQSEVVIFASPLRSLRVPLACFSFSMIAVYGARANSIGVSALLILVLNISDHLTGWNLVINAGYILAGAVWYTLLSLLLFLMVNLLFKAGYLILLPDRVGIELVDPLLELLCLRSEFYVAGRNL